jgi:hypothetical protein
MEGKKKCRPGTKRKGKEKEKEKVRAGERRCLKQSKSKSKG